MKVVDLFYVLLLLMLSGGCSQKADSVASKHDSQPTTEGLIAHYTFEDNTNDQVGSHHAKTNRGGLSYSFKRNKNEKVVNFSIANHEFAVIDEPFDYEYKTISFWVKADVIDENPAIVLVSDNPNKRYGLVGVVMKKAGDQKQLFFNIAGNPISIPAVEDTWYHVTLVGAAKNYAYYLNGSLIAQGSFETYKSSYNGVDDTILGASRIYNTFFSGSIDDLRIYNRALNAEEISLIAKH